MNGIKPNLKISVPEELPQADSHGKNFWFEFKIKQNITPRSYHSSVIHNSNLYVYGGYDANKGIMSELYTINLSKESDSLFKNVQTNGTNPGPLHRHSAVIYKDLMYIYGGKQSILENSNKLYTYDFETKTWVLINNDTNNDELPPFIDSHNILINNNNDYDEMIVFGGFIGGKISKYSRSIYGYSFKENKWAVIFDGFSKHIPKNSCPKKRANSSMILFKGNLFIFGGGNSKIKFDDLWKFDLNKKEWLSIKCNESKPLARCGHVATVYKENMIVFGGIHDIAHEKNDLFAYNFEKNEWSKIDSDFTETIKLPEKLLAKIPESKLASNIKQKNLITPKVSYNQNNSIQLKKQFLTPKAKIKIKTTQRSKSPKNKAKKSSILCIIEQPKSPKQIREERLKQQFLEKKHQLLAEFEIPDEESKKKHLDLSPTTETMKKSINSLGLHLIIQNEYEKKEMIRDIMNNSNLTVKDKKPCARDGCSGNLLENKLILFGGDRHNMTFKDLYILDLDKI